MIRLDDILMEKNDRRDEIDVDKLKKLVDDIEIDFKEWLDVLPVDAGVAAEILTRKTDASASSSDDAKYLNCPYNRQHTHILRKNYERHVNACRLKQNAYSRNEIVSVFFPIETFREIRKRKSIV